MIGKTVAELLEGIVPSAYAVNVVSLLDDKSDACYPLSIIEREFGPVLSGLNEHIAALNALLLQKDIENANLSRAVAELTETKADFYRSGVADGRAQNDAELQALQKTKPPEVGTMPCKTCGADRAKEPCKHRDISQCTMRGVPGAPEEIQWRNIKHVVRALADWAFGSKDDPKWGTAWIAVVTGLTCKDGPSFKLESFATQPEPGVISRAEWIAQAKAFYIESGDDEVTAESAARYLCSQQDWAGEDIDDPRESAQEDIQGRPAPEPVAQAVGGLKPYDQLDYSMTRTYGAQAVDARTFQQRVAPWMQECFGAEISADAVERNHRFFEEATELVQACGMTASEAHQLVDYTFGRPVGEPTQEVGGVFVTLAALCLANKMDMHECGEMELARISDPAVVQKIRAKQAAKPKHSPLPEDAADEGTLVGFYALPLPPVEQADSGQAAWRDVLAERRRQIEAEGCSPEHDDEHRGGELSAGAAAYALQAASQMDNNEFWNVQFQKAAEHVWQWDSEWWKPSDDNRRNLVKAGALILAEIERLDRAALSEQQPGEKS